MEGMRLSIFGWLLIFMIVVHVAIGLWKTEKWENQNKAGQVDTDLEQKNKVHLFTYFKR